MLRRKSRAGVYAERRYRKGLRQWRARMRPPFVALFGPFIAAGIAVLLLDGHRLSWLAGLVTGMCIGAWIAVRDTPPHYVERWHDGAEGERRTEKALRPLERIGWTVAHDVEARYGNYDHIVVGAAGVFLLESKNLQGIAEMRDGVLHLSRRLDPDAQATFERIRPRALAGAAQLKEDIERRTGQRTWVQSVVVLWTEFPQGLLYDGRCVFLHGSRLRAWLESKPSRLGQSDIVEIAAAVEEMADEKPPGKASSLLASTPA